MSNVELLLGFISLLLLVILLYLRWIYIRLEYESPFDPKASVNAYGESFTDAIQNGLARGQRGITTYGD